MRLKALIVDYGGVLTNSLADTFRLWLEQERLEPERFAGVMRGWLAAGAEPNIAHQLETGQLEPAEFEHQLALLLERADGSTPEPVGLLGRMFAGFRAEESMHEVVRRVRQAGFATALLSNSWGFNYTRTGWADLFDQVVISGEVGMRKPDPGIYLLTAQRLGLPPEACVFVDDLPPNVRGAAAVGMVGVQHTDLETTVGELEVLFDISLR